MVKQFCEFSKKIMNCVLKTSKFYDYLSQYIFFKPAGEHRGKQHFYTVE